MGFRLTGGTALRAFYLEHRLSEDLDFFLMRKSHKSKASGIS
jgi:predicted nucleotidyltransferase component of viral defense system